MVVVGVVFVVFGHEVLFVVEEAGEAEDALLEEELVLDVALVGVDEFVDERLELVGERLGQLNLLPDHAEVLSGKTLDDVVHVSNIPELLCGSCGWRRRLGHALVCDESGRVDEPHGIAGDEEGVVAELHVVDALIGVECAPEGGSVDFGASLGLDCEFVCDDVAAEDVVDDTYFVGVVDDGGAGEENDATVLGLHEVVVEVDCDGSVLLLDPLVIRVDVVYDTTDEVVRLVDNDNLIVKRVNGMVVGHGGVHVLLEIGVVVVVEDELGPDHVVELDLEAVLLFRAEGIVVGFFGYVDEPRPLLFLDGCHGEVEDVGEGIDVFGLSDGVDELPVLVFAVDGVAALLQFLKVVCAQGCGGHDDDFAVGANCLSHCNCGGLDDSLGNADGGACFTGTEAVVEEQAAIGGVEVDVVAHEFLVGEEIDFRWRCAGAESGLLQYVLAVGLEHFVDEVDKGLAVV